MFFGIHVIAHSTVAGSSHSKKKNGYKKDSQANHMVESQFAVALQKKATRQLLYPLTEKGSDSSFLAHFIRKSTGESLL